MLRLQVGYNSGESATKGALSVEGTLELEVRTVPFVLRLGTQIVRLLAAHRMVPAWEPQQSRHLTRVDITKI